MTEKKFKHRCGCITVKYKDGIKFVKMCLLHRTNKKYPYIAAQHPK